jgi:hypothetical protein
MDSAWSRRGAWTRLGTHPDSQRREERLQAVAEAWGAVAHWWAQNLSTDETKQGLTPRRKARQGKEFLPQDAHKSQRVKTGQALRPFVACVPFVAEWPFSWRALRLGVRISTFGLQPMHYHQNDCPLKPGIAARRVPSGRGEGIFVGSHQELRGIGLSAPSP